ncbi:hypothetical protein B0T16DRAFT_242277 [Cercophora newfieldiana]|uniref:ER membrane protein complex subunit 7 beta-sandwich domain-containing protein n=1 Tax=Cercophora newfieldiana TaxID=92897 RepID=A0AA39XUG9_9PEZI|nr:hypothetical protein B0T16DRAFT_242277 [Cercophora newfieldiana]
MRLLHHLLLLGTAALTLAAPKTTTLTLLLPGPPFLPNPNALPPSTHATLSALGTHHSAPLSVANAFTFSNVSAGSYLLDVFCATHAFAPLRVDVAVSAQEGQDLLVRVWETYRGNDWDNKGESVKVGEGNAFEGRVVGGKGYFVERSKFNAFAILKSPMILLGLVSMGIFLGLPYLVDNMDPEMRAEWEERQKTNPMNNIMGAATGQSGAAGGFDMAAFLAGSAKKEDSSAEAVAPGPSKGSGNGGGKKGKR